MDQMIFEPAAFPVARSEIRGFWPWLLQRITGLLLAIFLSVHIIVLHLMRTVPIDPEGIGRRVQESPFVIVFYTAFVLVVIFHAANGIRGILLDHCPSIGALRAFRILIWIFGFGVAVYGLSVLQAFLKLPSSA